MKNRNIFGGIALILLAIFLLGNGLGVFPDVPWFRIICTVFLGISVIRGFFDRHFFGPIMGLCLIAWIWDEWLGIEQITPFPLFFAGVLLGIGLNMLFKSNGAKIEYSSGSAWYMGRDAGGTENWQDGRHIAFENNFNSVSKYVNSDEFSSADLENNFGSANIYFNNAVMAGGQAVVKAENNFGEMNLYLPHTWRLQVSQNAAFGNVRVYGTPSNMSDAPTLIMNAESNFGNINIYFE